jgi:hypothetical protein
MTQEEIDARRRQLAEEYLALDDGSSWDDPSDRIWAA